VSQILETIQPHCRSELDELRVVALCPPAKVNVSGAKEVASVHFSQSFFAATAQRQHAALVNTLEQHRVRVVDLREALLADERAVSDQMANRVFVRDPACTIGLRLVVGAAGLPARDPDFHFARLSLQREIPADCITSEPNAGAIEFGDVLLLRSDAALINVGWRTTRVGVESLRPVLASQGVTEVGLVSLPRWPDIPHLDVAANVLSQDSMVACSFLRHILVEVSDLQRPNTYMTLTDFVHRHGYTIHWLPDDVDPLPNINFLHLDPDTVMQSSRGHHVFEWVQEARMRAVQVDVSELEKGGGGVRCVTMPLVRQ